MQMRRFYEHCRISHDKDLRTALTVHSSSEDPHHTGVVSSVSSPLVSSRCASPTLSFKLINIASHTGSCGVRVWQQFNTMSMSSVDISCIPISSLTQVEGSTDYTTTATDSATASATTSGRGGGDKGSYVVDEQTMYEWKRDNKALLCDIQLENVRRLSLENTHLLLQTTVLKVSGRYLYPISTNKSNAQHLCLSDSLPATPTLCSPTSINPLRERVPITSGPIREVYARPFFIIYGTPSDQKLRLVLKDLAVYIANIHLIASHTHVIVMSDIQYRGGQYIHDLVWSNVMFIGGPSVNRIMKKYCSGTSATDEPPTLSATSSSAHQYNSVIECHSPVKFFDSDTTTVFDTITTTTTITGSASSPSSITSDSSTVSEGDPHTGSVNVTATTTGSSSTTSSDHGQRHVKPSTVGGFSIGPHLFTNKEAVIFTLPYIRRIYSDTISSGDNKGDAYTDDIAYAVCLHATTVEGYHSLLRLAWPVMPPMVRSPFSAYLPDVIVLEQWGVWHQGFGAVQLAGYWNATWGLDYSSAYIHGKSRYG